jgi:hypothetical protein
LIYYGASFGSGLLIQEKIMSDSNVASGVVFHALRQGKILCDLPVEDTQKPGDWPEGHIGMPYTSVRLINCPICHKEALKVIGQEAGS